VEPEALEFYTRIFGIYTPYGRLRIMDSFPKRHEKVLSEYRRNNIISGVNVQILRRNTNKGGTKSIYSATMKYHAPIIKKELYDMSSGELCFRNMSAERIKVIYDIIPAGDSYYWDDDGNDMTETVDEEEAEEEQDHSELMEQIIQKQHISLLEREMQKILRTGKRIETTYNVLERKEKRMRRTSEGTNTRLRYFSYIIVMLLVGTSFFQSRYLKTYFHKKKLI